LSKKAYLLLITLVLVAAGCGPQVDTLTADKTPTTLTVFAAASLTESFTQLARQFQADHPNVNIQLNFAGSQTLRLQIEQGSRADVFASANLDHMDALFKAGLVAEPVTFTQNRLVVIVPANNPAAIESLADLTRPGVKLILAGPGVPVGRYARQSLEKLNSHPALGPNYAAQVLNNLVSEEDNVKGVVAKVRLGEADAGIVYASDVTMAVAAELKTISIPSDFNVQAIYPLAVTTGSTRQKLAQQFVEYVLSPPGQTVLVNHGFYSAQLQAAAEQQEE